MKILFHLTLLAVLSSHSYSRSLPRFEDYRVPSAQIDTGLSIGIRFPHPIFTDDHKEVEKAEERRHPNFAGHYIIAGGYILCGTGCISIVIVNARNGKIYDVPFGIENMLGAKMVADPRVEFQLNSGLLVIRGARNEKGWGTYYYQWKKNRLTLIRAIKGKIIPATSSKSTHWE